MQDLLHHAGHHLRQCETQIRQCGTRLQECATHQPGHARLRLPHAEVLQAATAVLPARRQAATAVLPALLQAAIAVLPARLQEARPTAGLLPIAIGAVHHQAVQATPAVAAAPVQTTGRPARPTAVQALPTAEEAAHHLQAIQEAVAQAAAALRDDKTLKN